MSSKFIKRYYKMKNYVHFDKRIHFSKLRKWIENKENITSHGFFPFIHDTLTFNKFDGVKRVPKERQIYIAAHKDRYIYERYSFLINQAYNRKAKSLGINNSSIAYRDCLGKNNIHFAKEVFDFIFDKKATWVIIGDFTDFFDRLNHKYLKAKLMEVLDVDKLPDDQYAVFKNSTRYSYVDRQDILNFKGMTRRELSKQSQIFSPEDFHKFKRVKPKVIKTNVNTIGVPQGSPISSIYSNVYMIDFDRILNSYITGLKGLYRRYSDDFVIVVPQNSVNGIDALWQYVYERVEATPDLILKKSKTRVYACASGHITNLTAELLDPSVRTKNTIDYLGFTFDGQEIRIRDKTIHKFYNRMYRKIQFVKTYSAKHGKNISRERLYKMYSHLGKKARKKHRGNFLSYVDRAQRIFGYSAPISKKTKSHWKKMHKRLALT